MYNNDVQLNDLHMIEQTLKTSVSEVEVLYWLVEDAYHKGNIKRSKNMFSFLLYIAKYKPELIRKGLNDVYIKRIKLLLHELFNNKSIQECKSIIMKPAIESSNIPFKTEQELKHYLVTHIDLLSEVLKETVKIWGIEVIVEENYRCDIIVESKKKCYPIELKIAQGTHAVVSQCSKYCYYLYRKLRYNHFKEIQGIIIANGYDQWSINELRREGHWIYNIRPTSNIDITLERIY